MKYILASASERRQELLHRIIDKFDVLVSDFDEDKVMFQGNIEDYVLQLAEGKALTVSRNIEGESVIIAADTIVSLNNCILGKPKDDSDAFKMLKMLSGNVHKVYSGVVVINTKNHKVLRKSLYTEVKFSTLSDKDIKNYIDTKEPSDKAGAYGIQGYGGVFVECINGCYYNVVGLPLNTLKKMLEEVM